MQFAASKMMQKGLLASEEKEVHTQVYPSRALAATPLH